MLKNYFKTAWRNIWKNRFFSAINIIGLSVGLAACIVIMLFVGYEKSFDNFQPENIYRLSEVQKFPGMLASQKVGLSMYPMGPTLTAEYPQIKSFTRVKWDYKYQITYKENKLFLPQVFAVDSTFLNIFNFKVLQGDAKTALLKPHSAMITAETAKKIFGNENPMGKTFTHYAQDTVTYVVTGVLADPPKNSQLQFDMVYSFNTIYKKWMDGWGGNWLNTYFKMSPNADIATLQGKMPEYLKRHLTRDDGWKYYELFFVPFKDIHAKTTDIGLDYLNFRKFDQTSTNLFGIIAIIVLVIACVNFMNLSTARSAERAREVGVRKSIGAHRFQLAGQFLGETVLLSLIALVFALILVEITLPFVNQFSDRNLSLPIFSDPSLILIILGCTILVGVLSGIYPAVFMSSFQPVKVLKGSVESGKNKGTLRNVLVVGQFASAIFLMIATVFVVKQLLFMQHRDPGFQRSQIVTVNFAGKTDENFPLFKQQLLTSSLVQGVTASQDVLGSHLDQTGVDFQYDNNTPKRRMALTELVADPDYLNVFKIKLRAGKNFSTQKSANGHEFIINETLAHELLKDHPGVAVESLIGKPFGHDSLGRITGIAKDFNFNTLHYRIETLCIINQREWGFRNASVKINGARSAEALAFIKTTWQKLYPDYPFEYQFLDDHFNEIYRADNQVSTIVGILAGLAILISCLGLFGLASYSAERRVKEIGVRKVLGASVQNIVMMLSGHFVKLVIIANVIAWPLAWYAMHKWLQDYAYKISISWGVFVLVALVSVFIALATISVQSVKAALANPVKSLRSE